MNLTTSQRHSTRSTIVSTTAAADPVWPHFGPISAISRGIEGVPRQRFSALSCTNILVARAGIEPATFRFSGGRSYRLSYLAGRHRVPRRGGDPDGTRTRDLRRDRAAR